MLCLERKRAERSRKLLLLMLLDGELLVRGHTKVEILPRVLSALASSTRETDFSGWYKNDSALGVIFTEVGEGEKNAIASAILARVMEALGRSLDAGEVDKLRITLSFFPEDWDMRSPRPQVNKELYPDLFRNGPAGTASHLVKRTMDIAGSIVALALLSPLFLLIALLIKLTSKGPVLFRQQRVGQFGRTFGFLKFRSMRPASDPEIHKQYMRQFISGAKDLRTAVRDEAPVFKMKDDPRVTHFGKFLRRSSLDELPQFWNVLMGDMSLVGPRPPIPYELSHYDIWHRRRVLEVKPGITGLWQVNGRSKTSFNEMVRLDLKYARTWSLWLDLQILAQTPRSVFSAKGAY